MDLFLRAALTRCFIRYIIVVAAQNRNVTTVLFFFIFFKGAYTLTISGMIPDVLKDNTAG